MGGPGSGSLPDNDWSRPGRKKRSAIVVAGTGTPKKPDGLPDAVSAAWDRLCELTAGVTFSQDSSAILMAARLIVRQDAVAEKLDLAPADVELNRTSLAIGRALLVLLGKLGLTPRDRQVLIVPRDEPSHDGPFEAVRVDKKTRLMVLKPFDIEKWKSVIDAEVKPEVKPESRPKAKP